MSNPPPGPFQRYLLAKRSVDDRALNRVVYETLAGHPLLAARPLRVLELGCGAGTMLERLLRWGLLKPAAGVRYLGLDADANSIALARETFAGCPITCDFRIADLHDGVSEAPFDLLIAHAVLDLLHLPTATALVRARLRPGGLAWLTLNFDGLTLLEPVPDAEVEERLLAAYHGSMDARTVAGRPAGDSRTGRRLFAALREARMELLAAGASDWVVFPRPGAEGPAYPGDEAAFLRAIVATIAAEPAVRAALAPGELAAWHAHRLAQIEAAELVYIAHQLDVLVQRPLD